MMIAPGRRAGSLLYALLGVAVGRRILAALTSASVAEVFLLTVIGSETVLDDVLAATMRTADDFRNHALTLTHRSHHSRLTHYPQAYMTLNIPGTGQRLDTPSKLPQRPLKPPSQLPRTLGPAAPLRLLLRDRRLDCRPSRVIFVRWLLQTTLENWPRRYARSSAGSGKTRKARFTAP